MGSGVGRGIVEIDWKFSFTLYRKQIAYKNLSNTGPRIDPRGAPNSIYSSGLCVEFMFVLYFLSDG